MTITDYRNFDLLITGAGERYRAFVVDAPAGAWLRDILNYPIPNPIFRRHP
jgi:hypothetical protein